MRDRGRYRASRSIALVAARWRSLPVAVAGAVAAKPGNELDRPAAARCSCRTRSPSCRTSRSPTRRTPTTRRSQPAYHTVTLTNLDGSGCLRGDWANIRSETGNAAYSPTNEFLYRRNDDRFEQVMAYYWITEAQKYIQSLGFGSTLAAGQQGVAGHPDQPVRRSTTRSRGTSTTSLRFGKGGVDDAEDAEVILHEYGHAIQDSQQEPFGFGATVEAGSIGEGFADYWAVTVADVVSPTPDPACVADWDSVSYTLDDAALPAAGRRHLHYPEDLDGRVHHDGQIWSRALWDIRNALGHVKADTIILEAHFGMQEPTMPELAARTVEVAGDLYTNAEKTAVEDAFQARGILP